MSGAEAFCNAFNAPRGRIDNPHSAADRLVIHRLQSGFRLREFFLHLEQLVADGERRQEEQARLADLPKVAGERPRLAVEMRGETEESFLLPVLAGDLVGSVVHEDLNLGHVGVLPSLQ